MRKKLYSLIVLFSGLIFGTLELNAQAQPILTGLDLDTDQVTVTNIGDLALNIASYRVCLGPGQYGTLNNLTVVSGDYDLAPNESVTFQWATISVENSDGAGGLGFFAPSGSFGSSDPSVYLDYIQWGNSNQDRSAQAVSAGRWSNVNDFISCPSPYTTTSGGNAFAWEEAEAGTVDLDESATIAANTSTEVSGDTATVCIDNAPAPVFITQTSFQTAASYRYVITDDANVILAISESDEIDLTGAGTGTCRIWGWSYRGIADNGNGFINGPLADLAAEDCSDISENWVTVVRVSGQDCNSLSIEDFTADLSIATYPNPTEDNLYIRNTSTNSIEASIKIFDIQGRQIYTGESNLNTPLQINMQAYTNGIYLIEISDQNSAKRLVKKIIKS